MQHGANSDDPQASTIRVDSYARLIRVTLAGRIDDTEAIQIYKRVASLPEFQSGFHVLFDSSRIAEPVVTGLGQYEIAKLSESDMNRVAIIATSAGTLGMAQMYEICANWKTERVGVFPDEQSALQWLGVQVVRQPSV